ncbi:hypothetical protein [Joostella sp.]|uniref:hypothetical protein n=1 Tax=Joostella sp. TaxID=2231138 RepID=UPI003A90DD48
MEMIGKKFNRLTIISFIGIDNYRNKVWKCVCVCGNYTKASTTSLKKGNTKSCGCLQKEKAAMTGRNILKTHGLSKNADGTKTRLFRIWSGMKTRCNNSRVVEYPRYGGKGVEVCASWMNYENFHKWSINNGYKNNLSIDRIDVDGNYEPSNCRWVTDKIQCRNRTSSRLLTFKGDTKTLSEFAEEFNISIQALHNRLKRGWSLEESLTIPLLRKGVDKFKYKKSIN